MGPLLATIAARLNPGGIAILTIVPRKSEWLLRAFLDEVMLMGAGHPGSGYSKNLLSNVATAVDPLDSHHLSSECVNETSIATGAVHLIKLVPRI